MKGFIEYYKDGALWGWLYEGDNLKDLPKVSCTSQNTKIEVVCNLFRKESKTLGYNNGYCGFRIPIDLLEVSNVDLISSKTGEKIPFHESYKVIPSDNIKDKLDKTIDFEIINKPVDNIEKVAIFSSFFLKSYQYSYHSSIIDFLKSNGYYVIFICSYDQETENEQKGYNQKIFSDSDTIIFRQNLGYDFGAYAFGYSWMKNKNIAPQNIVFINDSIVGPFHSTDFLKKAEQNSFWSITESYDLNYHIQSYLFGFKLDPLIDQYLNDFFFFRRVPFTNDKNKTIDYFELSSASFFIERNVIPKVMFPQVQLMERFENNKKEYVKSEKAFEEFFDKVEGNIRLDPTLYLWQELFEGFPFIKKKLINERPIEYPRINYYLSKKLSLNQDLTISALF